jgi:hypothetical protein
MARSMRPHGLAHGHALEPPRQPRPATPEAVFAWVAWFGFRVTRRRVMTQAQLADTLAGCVNQQINQELPGNITGI